MSDEAAASPPDADAAKRAGAVAPTVIGEMPTKSARVIVRTGAAAGSDAAVGGELLLGAALDNGLRIPVRGVSRNHARILREGEIYWLEDLGSTNGTFVNGQRVERTRLRHLDVITLGRGADAIFLLGSGARSIARPQRVVHASLEWLDGPLAGEKAEISPGETSLGRDWSSNLPVEVGAVSGLHARLNRTADHVTVQDLGSTNGTRVNDVPVDGVRALRSGDVVTLGGAVSFKVTIERTAAATGGPGSKAAFDTLPAEVFDQEWKTRLIWSPEELADIESARAHLRARESAGGQAGEGAAKPGAPAKAAPGDASAKAGKLGKAARSEGAARPEKAAESGKAAGPEKRAKPEKAASPEKAARPEKAAGPEKAARPEKAAKPEATSTPENAAKPATSTPAASRITGVRLVGESSAHQLGIGRAVVGRDLDADIWLDSSKVSRRHAVIEVTASGVWVEDLDSANGTRVNDEPITGKVAVSDGDELTFAGTSMRLEMIKTDG